MRLHDRLQRGEDLPHRLMKFRLTGISFFHLRQQCLQILVFHVRSSAFSQKILRKLQVQVGHLHGRT